MATEGLAHFQFHRDKTGYYYIALAMLVVVTAAIWLMQRSRFGIVLRAIRDDEEAAASLGFSTIRYKLVAMALSAGRVAPAASSTPPPVPAVSSIRPACSGWRCRC